MKQKIFRMLQLMPEQNADKWGEELGLTTSIPMALNMLCENKRGVIILDQLDALRWTNVHSRQALITCTEIIKRVEEINLNRIIRYLLFLYVELMIMRMILILRLYLMVIIMNKIKKKQV